jgi:IclR family pca regulon transcriptional regulator
MSIREKMRGMSERNSGLSLAEPELVLRDDYLDSLANGIAALRLFGVNMKSLSIQETADRLDLSRSAARRILLTLEHLGYLKQQGRKFTLTSRVLEFGYSCVSAMSLPEIARPIMQTLSTELDEPVALARMEGWDAVFIERIHPPRAFRIDFSVGTRLPAYAFSVGQVLLAGLDEAALDAYFRSIELKPLTPLTITDPGALRDIIAQIRRDGFRLGMSDLIYGVGGIVVPISNHRKSIVAAMVVPTFHGPDKDEMVRRYLPVMEQAVADIGQYMTQD